MFIPEVYWNWSVIYAAVLYYKYEINQIWKCQHKLPDIFYVLKLNLNGIKLITAVVGYRIFVYFFLKQGTSIVGAHMLTTPGKTLTIFLAIRHAKPGFVA